MMRAFGSATRISGRLIQFPGSLSTKNGLWVFRKARARCDFEEVPPGTYAMAVVHDENMNGKLDTGLLGIPTEGYGFSNDAKALFSAPSFADASFRYDGGSIDLTMSLHY